MSGFDTLYVPGMDHAGIATQVKVEQRLKEQGISRFELGRTKFIDKVWEWKEEYAQTIRAQWAKLGLSLDYSKEKFTYSPQLNDLVNYVFTEMYNKGLIYKAKRIVNWDPVQKTAISNIEVIYQETTGGMYHFKYVLADDPTKFLQVATTRPETMFGDVCVVVNPKDKRYQKFIGKKVINPVNQQAIPVLGDSYVEMDFGTGAMKCTPVHDVNDFILGEKYQLEQVICLNEDGSLNELCGEFQGLDRFAARKEIIAKLKAAGTYVKTEEIVHQVGYSERSNAIVEPYLSLQWFVKMDELASNVLKLQASDQAIQFFPKRFDDTLKRWMENANDWTISRQLWWGHQIPAWYHNTSQEIYVGVKPPSDEANWTRDPDVLDTWFSSAIWPFAVFDWGTDENNPLFKHYFPSNVLVTGYDIIFFWVARMIFQTQEFIGSKPFDDVLIHGLIRDAEGRKMSKSLGNGVDPMAVIKEYGADTLRHFLLTNSAPGQDLRYSEEKLRASWNFINKIWNAARYVMLNIEFVGDLKTITSSLQKSASFENVADKWILNKLSQTKKAYHEAMDKYEFTIAGKNLYKFIWDDYCSWYLELTKAELNSSTPTSKTTQAVLGFVLKEILLMLNPIMPFVTEEIYQQLELRTSIMEEQFSEIDFDFLTPGFEELVLEGISKIREFRTNQKIKNSHPLSFSCNGKESSFKKQLVELLPTLNKYFQALVNSQVTLTLLTGEVTTIQVGDCFFEILNLDFIDKEKQVAELLATKAELSAEIARSQKMLSNQNFIAKADPKKVELEVEKAKQNQLQYDLITAKLAKYQKNK
ncbi:valyl-tRNA synthetase [Spiroplasma clarkii]|nr:valyl-tRNA synthetase [Spiroplasma clarkii]